MGITLENLNAGDIRAVARHPDEAVRAVAAQRICRDMRSKILSDEERIFAHKLLKLMAEDSADMVRRALAVTLKNSPKLPRDIALKLAKDIDTIAVPVLTHSPVFTDEDLVIVLRSKAAAKALAVAKRVSVSDHVVRAIIRFGDSRSVAEVAANDGALISEDSAAEMLEIYKNDDLITAGMIERRDLPPVIVEKLIASISEEAAIRMTKRHKVSANIAIDLANRSRERAIVDFIQPSWPAKEMEVFVAHLHDVGRLTPDLIIRALGCGQMRFTEQALAALSGVSVRKSVLMIHDGGPFGLKALCARAGLNANNTQIIRAACAVYRDLELSGLDYDNNYFQQLMIERVLTLPFDLPEAEQYWFLEKLDGFSDIEFH